MHRKRRLSIQDLNPHLTCVLCGGYFIDATTIIECLHSFCRACIVRHLKGSKYCPTCDVQVHKTKPLQNIRHDPALQDIVYKLVPGLFQNEMRCRREFNLQHPESAIQSISVTDPLSIYTPDETFSLTLEYWNQKDQSSKQGEESEESREGKLPCSRRYLRCPGGVTIAHLHKLIRAKFDLNASHGVEFMHNDEVLQGHLSLMDVAYITRWKRKGPLHLTYRIIEASRKRIKYTTEDVSKETSSSQNEDKFEKMSVSEKSSDWKEVQIQISETGVMSVTGISAEEDKNKSSVGLNVEPNKCENVDALTPPPSCSKTSKRKEDHVKPQSDARKRKQLLSVQLGAQQNFLENRKQSIPQSDSSEDQVDRPDSSDRGDCTNSERELDVRPDEASSTSATTDSLTTPQNLSVEKIARTADTTKDFKSTSGVMQSKSADSNKGNIVSSTQSEQLDLNDTSCVGSEEVSEITPVLPQDDSKLNVGSPKSVSVVKERQRDNFLAKKQKSQMVKTAPVMAVTPTQNVKKATSGSMGYKTLKVPPKTWNPSITRSGYLNSKHQNSALEPTLHVSSVQSPKVSEKAPKFFKMRNMPRYLGNPASGVKPMYQVAGNSKTSDPSPVPKNKPIVMKIDPKTLSPIISVATSPSSLPGPQSKAFYTSASSLSIQECGKTASIGFSPTLAKPNVPSTRHYEADSKSTFPSADSSPRGISTKSPNLSLKVDTGPISTSNRVSKTAHRRSPSAHCSPSFPTSGSPTTSASSNILNSPIVSHASTFGLNTATLNMLASNPSFLPDATNFLYGNFANFPPPLLRTGLHMNSTMGLGPSGTVGPSPNIMPGLGAYHSMPPSINLLFPPHHRNPERGSSFSSHPPAVQRIPPSKHGNGGSNVGHKLPHGNNNNNNIDNDNNNLTSTSSQKKGQIQKSVTSFASECYHPAKTNALNPKNTLKQVQKSTEKNDTKQLYNNNEKVCSVSQQSSNIDPSIGLNNQKNNSSSSNSKVSCKKSIKNGDNYQVAFVSEKTLKDNNRAQLELETSCETKSQLTKKCKSLSPLDETCKVATISPEKLVRKSVESGERDDSVLDESEKSRQTSKVHSSSKPAKSSLHNDVTRAITFKNICTHSDEDRPLSLTNADTLNLKSSNSGSTVETTDSCRVSESEGKQQVDCQELAKDPAKDKDFKWTDGKVAFPDYQLPTTLKNLVTKNQELKTGT